jgi:hypothetical protein
MRSATLVVCLLMVIGGASLSAAAVNYKVPEPIPVIDQKDSMACWAATAAMMKSWKDRQSEDILTVLTKAGPAFVAMYKANTGLDSEDKPALLAALGLKAEPPANYSAGGIESMLKKWGPLWVTVSAQDPKQLFATHARIIRGISGDGGPTTMLDVIDPDGGREYSEDLGTFSRKFEELAIRINGKKPDSELRPQIVHF